MSREQDTAVTDVKAPIPERVLEDCLVVIYQRSGQQQGERHVLGDGVIRIGRDARNEIVLEDGAVSRHHVRLERRGQRIVVMDIGSTNGTLLNDEPLAGTGPLKNGDRLKIGSTIVKYLSGDDIETAFYEEIYQLAIVDNLTGLYNRRHFEDALIKEISRARRHDRVLSVMLMDIDRYKLVNDEYGHLAGDEVLRHVSQIISKRVRAGDVAARFGGEEIAVLMAETSLADAAAVAEEMRRSIASEPAVYDEYGINVTVSVGCAELMDDDGSAGDLLARTDRNLYAAKHAGRDRVVC